MKVLRKNVTANSVTDFEFENLQGFSFLVKNLTNSDILVCFNEFDENANIKIPAYMSQTITQNINHTNSNYATDTISVKSLEEGEVEVQCLEY